MSAPLLKIEHLEVRYGDLIGVADVSLDVPKGSVVALLGSNGAGKTTTLERHRRDRAGVGRQGRVRRREHRGPAGLCDRAQGPGAVARGLAAVHPAERREQPAAGRDAARRPRAHPAPARARLCACSRGSPSGGVQRAGTMSGGERQMLAVGRALMSEPELLMLDEPSLGLAPAIVDAMYDSFRRAFTKTARPSCSPSSRSISRSRSPTTPTCCRSAAPCWKARPRRWPTIPTCRRIYLGIE